MKKYIRICDCCGNTFETDMIVKCCKSCSVRMKSDFLFYKKFMERNGWEFPPLETYKMEYPTSEEEAFNY